MTWLGRLFRRGQLERQLDKELRFHLDQYTDDLIAQGRDPVVARRTARLSLGGAEQLKEECRDVRGTRWVEDFLQDLRHALRTMRKQPGFAAVALSTLALGIGATTVMFTLINGVLFKPLPYAEPARLVHLQEQTKLATQFGNLWAFAYPNYLDCKRESHSLDLAAWRYTGGTLTSPGDAEYVDGREISAELLPMLGVHPTVGRAFLPEDDRPGADPVVMISQNLWRRHFSPSVAVIGARMIFEGKQFTVAGVVPPDFRLGDEADVFFPLGQNASPFMQNRERHPGIRVWARLRPGTSLAAAQAELAIVGRHLAEAYPKSNAERTFIAETLRPEVGDVRSTLWILLGAVGLVLLIACVNIASLLLARAISSERELAMRAALGAGRGRLARQCLTESAVLGLLGGALGILLAALGIRPFVLFWPGSLPRAEEIHLDGRVLLFTLGISILSGLFLGIAPALRVPSRELEKTLRAGARSVAGGSRRIHGVFVASEIALAVVLLVSAGMLGRTLLRLSSLDPGVDVHNVLVTRAALSSATLASPEKTRAAWQDLLERTRQVPGVQAAAMVDTVPMREGNNQVGYWTTPVEPPANQQPLVLANSVTSDYLTVMGIPLRQGRFFTDQDRTGSEPVVVVDEVMAREAFGGRPAIGQHLWIGLGTDPLRVVGVVGHVRHWGLAGDDQARVRAQLYYPFAQVPDPLVRRWSELMSIAVRTGGAPLTLVEPLRRQVRGSSGDQVLYEVRTLEQLASATLSRQRFLWLLFSLFAGLALLLACIGIYGVLAYLTRQRVPEIGVRMALGATTAEVMWLILRQSVTIIFVGIAAGIGAALGAGRLLEHLVTGMMPAEVSTFAIMILILLAAALGASLVPARYASRIDPMTALRQD